MTNQTEWVQKNWSIVGFDCQTLEVTDTATGLAKCDADDLAARCEEPGFSQLVVKDLCGAEVYNRLPSQLWVDLFNKKDLSDKICPHCSEMKSLVLILCENDKTGEHKGNLHLCVCNKTFWANKNPFGKKTYKDLTKET